MNSINADLIRGHNDTIILRTLIDNDRYGYEIIDIIENSSSGSFKIKQPTLYNALKRLEKSGFITSYFGDESGGGRRRYYKLTSKGQELLIQDQKEWETTRSIIDKLLSDKQIDLSEIEPLPELVNLRPFTKRTHINNVDYESSDESDILESSDSNFDTTSTFNNDRHLAFDLSSDQDALLEETDSDILTASKNRIELTMASDTNALPLKTTNSNSNFSNNMTTSYDVNSLEQGTTITSQTNIFDSKKNENSINTNAANKEFFSISKNVATTPSSAFSEEKINAYNLLYGAPPAKKEVKIETDSPTNEIFYHKNKLDISENKSEYAYMRNSKTALSGREERAKTRSLNSLYAIYGQPETDTPTKHKKLHNDNLSNKVPTHGKLFNDIKNTLEQEGFKVKEYKKSMSNDYYYNNYIYKGKLVRDTLLLTFLSFVITFLLVISLNSFFKISSDVFLAIGLSSLILPLFGTLYYIYNPLRRAKTKYSTAASLINGLVIVICLFAITSIFFLLTPSLNINFDTPSMYVGLIFCLNIPLFSIYRFLLLRSKKYNVN